MNAIEIMVVLALPYVLAFAATLTVQRMSVLPAGYDSAAQRANAAGRMTATQRRALAIYSMPELVFIGAALLLALLWQADGWNGLALRWGLGGIALVRAGISLPTWRDLLAGGVSALHGPLRKIAFRQQRALATENGPVVVLPVEARLYEAHEAGAPVTIFYATYAKRVLAVAPAASAPVIERQAEIVTAS
jgi:hypothetical protein